MSEQKTNDHKTFLTDHELGLSEPKPTVTKDLLRDFDNYDFDAVYQRGSDVWTQQMKENLIVSILCRVPVGYVHVVHHQSKIDTYFVCDGKQRWQTVEEFKDNKFPIKYRGKSYYYSDFKEPENIELYRKFTEYVWDIRVWPSMSVIKQRDLFDRINAMSSLNPQERIYCFNFFCKMLLVHVHKKLMNILGHRVTKSILDDQRFAGIHWCHRLLHFCYGHDLRGVYTPKSPSYKDLKVKSAPVIDAMFINNLTEEQIKADRDNNLINEQLLTNIGIWKNLELIFRAAELFILCLDYSNTIKLRPDKNALIEMIVWLLNHLRNNTLTPSLVKEHKGKFHSVFKTYYESRTAEGFSQNQTMTTKKIKINEYLDELATKQGIDLSEKRIPLSSQEKARALGRADGKCPICECDLTNENTVVDHVYAASKFNTTVAVCLCRDCNNRKSNLTKEECDRFSQYIEKYGNQTAA